MKIEVRNKKVIVAGSGKSGIGATELLCKVGAKIVLYDGNEKLSKEEVREKLSYDIRDNIEIVIGEMTQEVLKDAVLMVVSPGIPIDAPCVEEARKKEIRIWGEIELAFQFAKGKIAAITGTNGKTTTTALTGAILQDYYKDVFEIGRAHV